jgi:hypothetical protein
MSANFLLKVANVLETLANDVESQEVEKTAASKNARDNDIRNLAQSYTDSTGIDLDKTTLDKLASADEHIFTAVKQLVEKTAGSSEVAALGGPSDKPASKGRLTKKEAAAASGDSFVEWIING